MTMRETRRERGRVSCCSVNEAVAATLGLDVSLNMICMTSPCNRNRFVIKLKRTY